MISEQDLYRAVGERVREARKGVNLTQDQLAQRVGLERSSITNIERGHQRVPLHVLYAIASALSEDPRKLIPEDTDISADSAVVKLGETHVRVPESVGAALFRHKLALRS